MPISMKNWLWARHLDWKDATTQLALGRQFVNIDIWPINNEVDEGEFTSILTTYPADMYGFMPAIDLKSPGEAIYGRTPVVFKCDTQPEQIQ
jgi:hypothetical protein